MPDLKHLLKLAASDPETFDKILEKILENKENEDRDELVEKISSTLPAKLQPLAASVVKAIEEDRAAFVKLLEAVKIENTIKVDAKIPDTISKEIEKQGTENTTWLKKVEEAVKGIKFDLKAPIVNVPAPKVVIDVKTVSGAISEGLGAIKTTLSNLGKVKPINVKLDAEDLEKLVTGGTVKKTGKGKDQGYGINVLGSRNDIMVDVEGQQINPATKENQEALIALLGDVQAPIPTDGDSVYEKDIWPEFSISEGFVAEGGGTGKVVDLFNNLHTGIINSSSDNPKTLFIHFNRTVVSNAIGLGTAQGLGDFSNVKIEIINSGEVATTVIDESSSPTKYTSRTFPLPVTAGFNALRITFHTADEIALTNCVVLKSRSVVARLQAKKPDNTIADINATAGGNLKMSVEEYDEAVDPIRKDIEGVGDITIGLTQVEIDITGTPTHKIRIRADINQNGIIYIGKTGILADGTNDFIRLYKGDEIILSYDDIDHALYAISDLAGQKINVGATL